jgi:nicotinamidase-related amidase
LIQGLADAFGRPLEFYVIGVARDVCVTQAVDGMQDRGYLVTALKDATWGLGLEPEEETLARWAKKGQVLTVAELPI